MHWLQNTLDVTLLEEVCNRFAIQACQLSSCSCQNCHEHTLINVSRVLSSKWHCGICEMLTGFFMANFRQISMPSNPNGTQMWTCCCLSTNNPIQFMDLNPAEEMRDPPHYQVSLSRYHLLFWKWTQLIVLFNGFLYNFSVVRDKLMLHIAANHKFMKCLTWNIAW